MLAAKLGSEGAELNFATLILSKSGSNLDPTILHKPRTALDGIGVCGYESAEFLLHVGCVAERSIAELLP